MISDSASNATLTPEVLVPRLGDYLLEKGLITASNLKIALRQQAELRAQGKQALLGEILVDIHAIDRPS